MKQLALYFSDIRLFGGCREEYMGLLTPDRRARTEQIVPERERLHSLAAGLLLRRVLNVRRDSDVRIGSHGKPELATGGRHFSISHGGDYAVLAVFDSPVGVDIEPVSSQPPLIPQQVFLDEELEWLGKEPSALRFALVWTRLESALKADGRGFELENRERSVFSQGEPWYINTLMHDGHVLSCAAGEAFEVKLIALAPDDLIT